MEFDAKQFNVLIFSVHLLLKYSHLCFQASVFILCHVNLELQRSFLLKQVFLFNTIQVNLCLGRAVCHDAARKQKLLDSLSFELHKGCGIASYHRRLLTIEQNVVTTTS